MKHNSVTVFYIEICIAYLTDARHGPVNQGNKTESQPWRNNVALAENIWVSVLRGNFAMNVNGLKNILIP